MKIFNPTELLSILFFATAIFVLQSCGNNTGEDRIATTISGKIDNPGDYLIEFVVNDSTYIVDLEEDNSFRFTTTELTEPSEIQFIHARESGYIYLTPGSELKMNFDYNTLYESATFDGATAPETRYIFDIAQVERSAPDQSTLYRLDEEDFLRKIEEIRKRKTQQATASAGEISDSSFLVSARGNIYYEWANHLISYQNMHAILTQDYGFTVSDSLKTIIEDIPLEKPGLLRSYRYINFLFDKVSNQVNESLASTTIAQDQVQEVMLKRSIEVSREMIRNEEIEKRLIREFIVYYYPDLKKKTRNKVLKEHQNLIDEQLRRKLRASVNNSD